MSFINRPCVGKARPSCDCGQPADRHTPSGWACDECIRVVRLAQAAIDDHIAKQRAESAFERIDGTVAYRDDRKEYYRAYWLEHREESRARWRKWKAKQPKVQQARFNAPTAMQAI